MHTCKTWRTVLVFSGYPVSSDSRAVPVFGPLSCFLLKLESKLRWPTRAIQKYNFQYNNIYSSTTICIPVQKYIPVLQYIFQYTNMFFSTTLYISIQILFRYRIINSGTEILIQVRKYKFQYRNIICSSTEAHIYSATK